MKTNKLKLTAIALAMAALGPATFAQLNIPSDGSDGALNVTSGTTVIDLSQAVTGTWSNDNAANAGKGIYDSNKWAVVFKYSSVNIASNAVVSFANHPSHAPVVWLVSGDVTVGNNSALVLDGGQGLVPPGLSEPGPGGFRGGTSYYALGVADSPGFGPGGGQFQAASYFSEHYGGGGSYGSLGNAGSTTYGNPSLIPLIGGSGGGGGNR